jgi:HlyD family secretion protein
MHEYSTTANFAAAPAPLPDTRVSPPHVVPQPGVEPPRSGRWLLISGILALVVVIAIVAAIYLRGNRRAEGPNTTAIRTAVVERRDLVRSVRLNGTVEATQSYLVAAPSLTGGGFNTLVITKLAKAGTTVKKGDLLVEFDPQNQLQNAIDQRATFRDLEEQINKKKADQASARAKDDTELKQAEDAMKSAEFEVQRNEVVSKIDAEKNQQNLEEARAKLAQLKDTYELKRKAARSELRIVEIQRDRARNAMVHAENNARKMTITSPLDGMVVLSTIWKGSNMGEVQEGDEVRTGVPFMQVMNPTGMQVRAKVNQADVNLLRPGAPVEVHLDAYPDLSLPGRLERVAAIGVTSFFSTKVHTFVALFSIQGTAARVMPDLTAAVDAEVSRTPNALVVPRDAVVSEGDSAFVWVKSGKNFRQQPVKVTAVSDAEAALESGVSAGDVVLRTPESAKGGS